MLSVGHSRLMSIAIMFSRSPYEARRNTGGNCAIRVFHFIAYGLQRIGFLNPTFNLMALSLMNDDV